MFCCFFRPSGIAGAYSSSDFFFFFDKSSCCFLAVAAPVYISTNSIQGLPFFPHPYQILVVSCHFDKISDRCDVV